VADAFADLTCPAAVYVLSSDEPLLVNRAIAALRDASVEPAVRAFNYDVIEGKGATAARVLAAAQTMPMMARRRMVLLREAPAMAAAELALLAPYLDSPNPTTVLVVTATKIDRRIKFYAVAKKKKCLHELSAPRRVGGWIRDELGARGIKMSADAQRRLADVVGNDLARLSLSIDQLALYAGDRAVQVDDVDDLVAQTRERTVFELTDAIGAGDAARAYAAVAALCDQRQSTIGVVMMMARHMRQLALCKQVLADTTSTSEIARRVGVPPFVADKLADQARRYSGRSLAKAIGKLSEADRTLKGHIQTVRTLGRGLGERVVLDRLVRDLIGLAA
jgi:DNA polymerase-3 subunit delta